ncbi:MAG: hypothetical protein KAH57_05630 [Thermoplasmata archaeon]|nr:hypothetical protein [Thermoplasmata archaeon]
MECNIEANRASCPCTYACSKKGKCCECVAYHRERRELPGCYFTKEVEATWDRSIENYMRTSR